MFRVNFEILQWRQEWWISFSTRTRHRWCPQRRRCRSWRGWRCRGCRPPASSSRSSHRAPSSAASWTCPRPSRTPRCWTACTWAKYDHEREQRRRRRRRERERERERERHWVKSQTWGPFYLPPKCGFGDPPKRAPVLFAFSGTPRLHTFWGSVALCHCCNFSSNLGSFVSFFGCFWTFWTLYSLWISCFEEQQLPLVSEAAWRWPSPSPCCPPKCRLQRKKTWMFIFYKKRWLAHNSVSLIFVRMSLNATVCNLAVCFRIFFTCWFKLMMLRLPLSAHHGMLLQFQSWRGNKVFFVAKITCKKWKSWCCNFTYM